MELRDAILKIFQGDAILFTGAGFSTASKNLLNKAPKTANQLTELLYQKINEENDFDLTNAAEMFIDKFGSHELIQLLKNEYSVVETNEEIDNIVGLPWKRIYTTNYDNCIELSALKQKQSLTTVTLMDKHYNYKFKRELCIHLNGSITRLTPETLFSEFKLTNVSYLTNDFSQSEWVQLFRNDLQTSTAIFFVGFSLKSDLDLRRIVYAVNSIDKTFFILKEDTKESVLKPIEKFGTPVTIGLSKFSKRIRKLLDNNQGIKEKIDQPFYSFFNYKSQDKIPSLYDSDVRKLLFEGFFENSLIDYSITNPNGFKYFIKRDAVEIIEDGLSRGYKNFLIHSSLGNGKTIFLNGLATILKIKDYDVYIFEKYTDTTDYELERICTVKDKKTVLIVESYSNHMELLEKIKLFRTDDCIVIVSERTIINDTVYLELEDKLFGDKYLTVDLNQLSDSEIDKLIELIDTYGFWGDFSSYSKDRKQTMIKIECERSFKLLLLKIIKSPDIIKRLENILSTIKNKKGFYAPIILVLVSNAFGFRLFLDDLIYIMDDELLNNPSFYNNQELKEIINFDRKIITVKSSIISEAIILSLESQKIVIDVLANVAKKLNEKRSDQNYRLILKSITSFARINGVLSEKSSDYNYNIVAFFERVKSLEYNKTNPHFWLQYAIARLAVRHFSEAGRYFETAYSFAHKLNFNTYQIDNQYARYLIDNEIYNGIQATCMNNFLKAHAILSNPADKEMTKHFPIKVALKYYPFYNQFFAGLSPQDKKIFVACCNEILDRINWYYRKTPNYRIYEDVKRCEKLLKEIIDDQKNNTVRR